LCQKKSPYFTYWYLSGVTKYGTSAAGTETPPPVSRFGIGPVTFGAEFKAGGCGVGGVIKFIDGGGTGNKRSKIFLFLIIFLSAQNFDFWPKTSIFDQTKSMISINKFFYQFFDQIIRPKFSIKIFGQILRSKFSIKFYDRNFRSNFSIKMFGQILRSKNRSKIIKMPRKISKKVPQMARNRKFEKSWNLRKFCGEKYFPTLTDGAVKFIVVGGGWPLEALFWKFEKLAKVASLEISESAE